MSNRSKGDGCPYCAGHLAIPGENDLATLYPEIAAQWCEERNGDKKPEQFRPGSNEKVWWRCERGHEWETMITSRVEGHGCPYCSGLLAIPGENDLTTLFPDIAAQWNREKNGDVNNGGRATAARDFSPPRTGKVPILAAAEPSL